MFIHIDFLSRVYQKQSALKLNPVFIARMPLKGKWRVFVSNLLGFSLPLDAFVKKCLAATCLPASMYHNDHNVLQGVEP